MILWPVGVNQKVRRNGTNWELSNGVIEDKTRSGKTKRRLLTSKEKKRFSVSFVFSVTEYELFLYWWENNCFFGFYSFLFPCIDGLSQEMKEYRVVAGSKPRVSNPNGNNVNVSMEWEEV